MSINTNGLPPYDEQKVVKIKKPKQEYIAPMNIISQMKAKEYANVKNQTKKK